MFLNEPGCHAASKEGGVGQDVEDKGDVGAHATDAALNKSAPQLMDGVLVVRGVAGELCAVSPINQHAQEVKRNRKGE